MNARNGGSLSRPAHDSNVDVSVVMPCLNERNTVGKCVLVAARALVRLGSVPDVVVADNGSCDGSQDIAKASGARVVYVAEKGYGAALRGGISVARGEYVVIGDSDDSYDFEHVGAFISQLQAGDDLVVGNRFRGGIESGAMPWHHRYFGNPVLTGILNLMFQSGIGDAHCGLRAFVKSSYDKMGLTSPGMEFASEMIVKAALLKMRISEVPVVLKKDGRNRPPHLRSFRDGFRHLSLLMRFGRKRILNGICSLISPSMGDAAAGMTPSRQ